MSYKSILNESHVEEIDITPDISLMPKLSYAGYSAPQAIGELVDNAIDERLDGQKLKVSIKIKKNGISVADNGSGMTKKIATKALVLAFSKKEGKLGEFGLGLKTACLSLGNHFEVITTAEGQEQQYQIVFDQQKWESRRKGWKVPCITKKSNKSDHFTIVNIERLKIFYSNLPNYIRDDLKKRYAPFISNNQVEIKVNRRKCVPEEVALHEGSKKEFAIDLPSGNKIYGWYGLLREGSQKGLYGFSTFRRNRMITNYDKFGFDPHPMVARLVGEVHLDHVPPTHNKREFIKESIEYKEAEAALRKELKDILRQARKKATEDTVTDKVRQEVNIWKDKIGEALRSDDFKSYTSRFDGIEPSPKLNSEDSAELDVEKRAPKVETSPSKIVDEAEKSRTPTITHKQKRHIIRVKGKNIEFKHDFVPLGIKGPWKTYSYDKDSGLEIFTNTDFPAYSATKDTVFYAVVHIAEGISEFFVQAAQEEFANVDELKQVILRKAAMLKTELTD